MTITLNTDDDEGSSPHHIATLTTGDFDAPALAAAYATAGAAEGAGGTAGLGKTLHAQVSL